MQVICWYLLKVRTLHKKDRYETFSIKDIADLTDEAEVIANIQEDAPAWFSNAFFLYFKGI